MTAALRSVTFDMLQERHRFNRLDPNPPPYLYVLRQIGHWRRWKHAGTYREISTALRNAYDEWSGEETYLPESRGCFLDAGCGHSSDAFFAMERWGFKEGVKVDLFPPYDDIPHFREQMEQFERNRTRFIQGDICKLSDFIPADSVDMIGCAAVLDLMCADDRNLFYNEAFDVLRGGGILTISYVRLSHGYGDWKWGTADRRMAVEAGFDVLVGRTNAMILQKPEFPQ